MHTINESVIGVIFSKNREEILLIKRRDVPVWVLPGGGIDEEESTEQATIREVFEETGLETNILKKIGEYHPINKLTKLTHVFECKVISGDIIVTNETKDIRFFNLKNLPKLIPPPHPEWIKDALKNEEKLIIKKLDKITYFALFKNFLLHPILVIRFILSKIGFRINS